MVSNQSSPFSRLFRTQQQPSLTPPNLYTARRRRSRLLLSFHPRPLKASLSNKLVLSAKAGRAHAPQPSPPPVVGLRAGLLPLKPSPSPCLLPPRVRVAGRARSQARWLPISQAAAVRREGRGCFLWGPALFGPASLPRLRPPARSPSWNWEEEGEGDRDESGAVVRREAETEKRGRGGEGTAHSHSLSATLRSEKGRGRRPGWEWGLSPSDPGVRGTVRPDVLRVGPLSVAEDLGFRPFRPEFPGLTPRFSNIRDFKYLGFIPLRAAVSGVHSPRVQISDSASVQISGVQTPQSEIRDSATVALEEEEDWTARSDRVVTPSPPGEASRARPSGRAKAEEEVARGKVSLPLSLLGRAAGGPQEEAEALGHHSDPYQRCFFPLIGKLGEEKAET
ncbi:hypothetical protein HPG69_005218 [Diceros bicornis minor]|uniref:Uncharacterized protein n=1 Tax=Diceros bicornis minor TaxID=77932 RepID=A0A7J7EGB7_DICBM|nr:hypothetical protein HPG69_005218 [Diceros bicornis minor]